MLTVHTVHLIVDGSRRLAHHVRTSVRGGMISVSIESTFPADIHLEAYSLEATDGDLIDVDQNGMVVPAGQSSLTVEDFNTGVLAEGTTVVPGQRLGLLWAVKQTAGELPVTPLSPLLSCRSRCVLELTYRLEPDPNSERFETTKEVTVDIPAAMFATSLRQIGLLGAGPDPCDEGSRCTVGEFTDFELTIERLDLVKSRAEPTDGTQSPSLATSWRLKTHSVPFVLSVSTVSTSADQERANSCLGRMMSTACGCTPVCSYSSGSNQ